MASIEEFLRMFQEDPEKAKNMFDKQMQASQSTGGTYSAFNRRMKKRIKKRMTPKGPSSYGE
jgi:hypothetical protein